MHASKRFWQNRNVFVTGATGFLGSWLTRALVETGADVVCLVRDHVPASNLNRTDTLNLVTVARGELEDYLLLERVLNEYEIDTVFHVAAQTIVPIAIRSPLSTFRSNIMGTWNLLEACRRTDTVNAIVVASSDKAYGAHKKLPYAESMPLQGRAPYDVSKSAADLIAQSFHHTYQLPVVITRCGNFFGGGDLNFNRLVPGTIRSLIFDEPPVIRSDGTYIRDYFYVEDAVAAYLLVAERLHDLNLHGHAFNFSTGEEISAIDMVNAIIKIMGSSHKPKILNAARHEIPRQYLSSAKARRVLGWQPKYERMAALEQTINWYRDFFREKQVKT